MEVLARLLGRRSIRLVITVFAVVVCLGVSIVAATPAIADLAHKAELNSPAYKAENGQWDIIPIPDADRVNAVHAALLSTGKILIVAGTGDNLANFAAGTFKTMLYDPATRQSKLIPTPADMFCGGHAFLPDGKLLVAGGTARYEVLDNITKAAGTMTVKNEAPNYGPRTFPKGTEFIDALSGIKYRTDSDLTVQPATKVQLPQGGVKITASQTTVFVEAEDANPAAMVMTMKHFKVVGLTGNDAEIVYGMADRLDLSQQDFQGMAHSYEFDPKTEQYVQVMDMHESRWYPTLTGLPNGDVMAVSGLDQTGHILMGKTEIFDPKSKTWTERPDLSQYFPTYPALYQTGVPGQLFYTGANSGYGPPDQGRLPGFWNLNDNSFRPVPGIRDPKLLETAGSAWVGPVQNQRMMVVGGGAVGDAAQSTGRIDTIDLNSPAPSYQPGPSLADGTRYPEVVTLPDDTALISGGSTDYRGRNNSDLFKAYLYHPDSNTLSSVASPTVGRNYHSEALLLPDGRVITMGSDPLFDQRLDPKGRFEQRIEIYTPPYLFGDSSAEKSLTKKVASFIDSNLSDTSRDYRTRPVITGGPDSFARGTTAVFTTANLDTSDPQELSKMKARLIRPSAVTHVTDVEQRSVALELKAVPGGVALTSPAEPTFTPPGYYMLFITDQHGTPSVAKWVLVP